MTVAHTRPTAVPAASAGFFPALARSWRRATAMRLARRSKTPAAKAAGVPVGPAERVLTIDRGAAGLLVAATAAAVYIPDHGEPGCPSSRLGWEEVTRIGWDDRRCVLALTGVGPGGMWRKELALARHSALAELAEERVRWTLLASATVRHGDQVCAVVTARRQPGSGKVIWVTLLNGAWDPDDRAVRARVAAAIADLQAQTGIPAEQPPA